MNINDKGYCHSYQIRRYIFLNHTIGLEQLFEIAKGQTLKVLHYLQRFHHHCTSLLDQEEYQEFFKEYLKKVIHLQHELRW